MGKFRVIYHKSECAHTITDRDPHNLNGCSILILRFDGKS
jgi:hypothetical protein